jgi:hypothetical protein
VVLQQQAFITKDVISVPTQPHSSRSAFLRIMRVHEKCCARTDSAAKRKRLANVGTIRKRTNFFIKLSEL